MHLFICRIEHINPIESGVNLEGVSLNKEQICPEYGSQEFKMGEFKGYGSLFKKNAMIKSSEVDAYFCVNCGCILTLKVRNPEKFL